MRTHELPPTSFADIAVALLEAAQYHAGQDGALEVLAAKLVNAGMNEENARRILARECERTKLIADAHLAMKVMCEREDEIRRLVARERWRPEHKPHLFQRLMSLFL